MKRLTYFLLGLLILSSCEQDAFFEVPEGHTKLFAFSEITTDTPIKVALNTAPGINSDDDFEFPKQPDAQVVLMKNGVELDDPGFRYIAREEAFVSQGAFRPEAGVEYSLKISLKNDVEILPIVGSTVIPKPQFLEHVFLKSFVEQKVNPLQKEFTLSLDIDFKDLSYPKYILKPYFINAQGENEALLVKSIRGEGDCALYSKELSGIIVDAEKLSGKLSLELTNDALASIDTEVSKVFFEVNTITEEGYRYYVAFSRQSNAQAAAISEPVISFTNFENGLGLFTGYSSTVTEVEIF